MIRGCNETSIEFTLGSPMYHKNQPVVAGKLLLFPPFSLSAVSLHFDARERRLSILTIMPVSWFARLAMTELAAGACGNVPM